MTAENLLSLRGPEARVSVSRDVTGWNGSRAHARGPADPGSVSQARLLQEAFPGNPTHPNASGVFWSGAFQPVFKRVSSRSDLAEMLLSSAPAATRVHGFSLKYLALSRSAETGVYSQPCAALTVGPATADTPKVKSPASEVGWFSSHGETAPLPAGKLGCSRASRSHPHPSPSPQATCFSKGLRN